LVITSFLDVTPCRWVQITKLHGTQNLWMCKTIERKMEQQTHCTYVILWHVLFTIVVVEKE